MPHRTQLEIIKRRLVGKEGRERTRELRAILNDLPGYRNGPYADIRKWVTEEIERTRVRTKTVHRDSIAVVREGAAQVAFAGRPNAGKSSLLQALSHIQIRTGDYAFTTLKPVPALTRIHDVLVQLVEIPGLVEGAEEGRGAGRALLGVLRGADAVVYCHEAGSDAEELRELLRMAGDAAAGKPAIVCATKVDEAPGGALRRVREVAAGMRVVGVSVLDEASLDSLREAIWSTTGLVRVFTRRPGDREADPMALPRGATVLDVARALHGELAGGFEAARVWGPSARFDGQRVGREHPVADGDVIEILRR